MSLYFAERVKEQKADDRRSDKNIVFTKPWIINFPIQIQNPDEVNNEEAAAETSFKTSYKMASTSWNVWLKNDFTAIIIKDARYLKWKGDCFISYTLYYDAEMRFEYFSSTRIQMDEIFTEYGYGKFQTPEGYMARFIGGINSKKISRCVVFVELHLPVKYFLQPSLKTSYGAELSDKLPDDYETDFRFEFLKNSDYTFECLDGTVPAQRRILFTSSDTMKKQLSPQFHHTVGIVMYTVAVVKPIIIFFHSHIFKLPESFSLDYIDRLLHAIKFFQPSFSRNSDMITKVENVLIQKFIKEKHDFNSLLEWISFGVEHYQSNLLEMINSLIANEYYFKLQQTIPITERNMENALYRQFFGRAEATRNARYPFPVEFERPLADEIFEPIDRIFINSFLTNVILL